MTEPKPAEQYTAGDNALMDAALYHQQKSRWHLLEAGRLLNQVKTRRPSGEPAWSDEEHAFMAGCFQKIDESRMAERGKVNHVPGRDGNADVFIVEQVGHGPPK